MTNVILIKFQISVIAGLNNTPHYALACLFLSLFKRNEDKVVAFAIRYTLTEPSHCVILLASY